MMKLLLAIFLAFFGVFKGEAQSTDSLKVQIITSDIDNFWQAYDAAKPDFKPEFFQKLYIDKGSKGIRGFMKNRIQNAEYLASVVKKNLAYYESARQSTLQIAKMEGQIRESFIKLKEIYPRAVFPSIYFVMGTLNSGGTTSGAGLIIGAEMYGLTPAAPLDGMSNWLKTVLKPVDDIPHIVAHELIHFQQKYDGGNLLSASIKEGSADFIAELISGKHINQHVHDFADKREKELWMEFRDRMFEKDYKGWLYSSIEGRPNDLGYWMGYKISKSYYDNSPDKKKAVHDIMNIRDFENFLEQGRYPEKFK